MNGSKNLILAFGAPHKLGHLVPFIASLRHTGFTGDVCLLVEAVSAELVGQLRDHGILVERTAATAVMRMTSAASRYFSMLDWLSCHGGHYARVMLVDPLATVFQGDPFATPWSAGITYTRVRRKIGEDQALREAIVQAYGEGVAENLRDFPAANPGVTFGTGAGILRYLVAMTRELAGRTTPITNAVDQAVHNYLVHMHPLRDAWLDTDDRLAVALGNVSGDAVQCTQQNVLVDGRAVPVLSQWDASAAVTQFVRGSPHCQIDASMRGAWPAVDALPIPPSRAPRRDAVVACYQRQRDADWLALFVGSLRCVNDSAELHCIGDFDQSEMQMLAGPRCIVHRIPATDPAIAENIAHLYISQALDRIGAAANPPDQVLVLDGMHAFFPRDPFAARTIGLSVCAEGPTRIADSDYNLARLAFFVPREQAAQQLPIVSSGVLRGTLPVVREFYRHLLQELVGRTDLLGIHKVVQGAMNKLCHLHRFDFPVIVRPNGGDAYFDIWRSDLAIDTRHGVRIGGTVPSVVVGGHPESSLMLKLRIDLSLSDV